MVSRLWLTSYGRQRPVKCRRQWCRSGGVLGEISVPLGSSHQTALA